MRPLRELLTPKSWALLEPMLKEGGAGKVAAFDADGTLWRSDVGEELLRHLAAERLLPRHQRAGVYEDYERLLSTDPARAYVHAVELMEELEEAVLIEISEDLFTRRFVGRVFPFTRPLLDALAKAGFSVWLVSASPRWIVQAGAEALGLDPRNVLAIDAKVLDGRLTKEVLSPAPVGEGKVRALELKQLVPALAVGNGELDLPMLAYAKAAMVVAPFDEPGNHLVQEAQKRGWPVQRA